ncbi:MAG: hypothetical protein P4L74_00545 [Candidatus Doudnabacteria bacterium]|nr:hypothetical protein [Candidatus Doudnabacteria bacterium]
MNKKAIAILGAIFVLIVGTLGFLIYLKYSGSSKTPAPSANQNQNGNPAAGSQPATTTAQTTGQNPATTTPVTGPPPAMGLLTSDQVVSPALFFNGGGITYFDNQGNLFQAAIQTNAGQLSLTGKKQLDIPTKSSITKIFWPQKGNDFIIQTNNPVTGRYSWSYFNSTLGTYTDFPPQVASFDWMPNGTQIAYIWINGGKAVLEAGDPAFKSWQKIGDLYQNDNVISVSPDGSQILFYESEPAGTQNPINSVSIDGKVWKGLIKDGFNYGVLWSPDGQKFIFGKKDPVSLQFQLWYDNLASGETKNLGLFTTTQKAVWGSDSNTIYAAVPSSPAANPNSLTNDTFFRLNTTTLDKQQFSIGNTPVDGENLFLSTDGNDLFFKNAQDGGLYYLNVAQ